MSFAAAFFIFAVVFAVAAPILKNKLNHYCDRHWDWQDFEEP